MCIVWIKRWLQLSDIGRTFFGLKICNEASLSVALFKTREVCNKLGFCQVATAKIITATSELGQNILKYAGVGQVVATLLQKNKRTGIEIVVLDEGTGIVNIQTAMQDHFSTSGTLGLGLPGVKRLMDEFFIDSKPGNGTMVRIRKYL